MVVASFFVGVDGAFGCEVKTDQLVFLSVSGSKQLCGNSDVSILRSFRTERACWIFKLIVFEALFA